MKKACTAVIVAAGSAQRMQSIDKIMTDVGGVPMLLRTVRAIAASQQIESIIIVTREDLIERVKALCAEEEKVTQVLVGGSTRSDSVVRGLRIVETSLVAIHDGARPLVTTEVIDKAIAEAAKCGAAAPAIAVHDTIKLASDGIVKHTPRRSHAFAVQTPQVFDTYRIRGALRSAIQKELPLSDDCLAAEYAGMTVHLTEGSRENIKITVPFDLKIAELILKERGEIQ